MTEYVAGPEMVINPGTFEPNSTRAFQDVITFGNGDYLTTYAEGSDIYAQRYSASGTPIGAEVRVNSATAGFQIYPAVTLLSSGDYVIAWKHWAPFGEPSLILAQRFNSSGSAVGNEVQVSASGNSYERAPPAIASLADGGYVITWPGETDIFAQRYSASSDAIGNAFKVNSLMVYGDIAPEVTGLSDGGFVVTWKALNSASGISAQRFDAGGAKVGGEVEVATYTPDQQSQPDIATLADGDYVVTWQSLGQDGSGFGIFAQRFDSNGTKLGGEVQVNTFVNSDQVAPKVTALADGGFVITWRGLNTNGAGEGIFAQRFDAEGMAVGGEIQVNVEDHAERDPVITASSDGSFLVLWNRVGGEFSYGGTLARRFSPVASMVGDTGDNELTGTASADTFEGLGGNDVIAGLSGNDILTGGEGSDRLFGGAGNDTLSAENMIAFDVGATVDYLYGGDGNDIIFSGFGDIVDGGQGFDTVGLSYVGASHGITGDTAILHRGEPLIAGGGTFHSIERFSDIAMTQFDDKMVIGDQKDSATVRGWNGNDHLIGQEMSITMYGGNGNDLLVGSTANDLLYGDDGNDILIGHLGMDSLWGGAGADRFIINQLDVLDRIIDFEHGVDKIDVSDIDADISTAGNQAFTFIGTGNFTGAAGQLRIAFTSRATYIVEGDINGDGRADLIIDLGFPSTLTQGDFLL